MLYNIVVAALASSPKLRLFTLVDCYGTCTLSAEKRWECYQSCIRACLVCPCTDLATQHMRGYTAAADLSINDSYKAQCWAQDENLNWNKISFTINGTLGPVYDCATETSLLITVWVVWNYFHIFSFITFKILWIIIFIYFHKFY